MSRRLDPAAYPPTPRGQAELAAAQRRATTATAEQTCPLCHAEPGWRCTTSAGEFTGTPHAVREAAP